MKRIYILGIGGHGRETLEVIYSINENEQKYEIAGFIDELESFWGKDINGVEILGGSQWLKKRSKNEKINAVISLSDANRKKQLVEGLDEYVTWENVIHPTCSIATRNQIGKGNIVQPYTIIGPNTRIGNHCILNAHSVIGHDAVLSDYVTIAPHVLISGGASIGNGTNIGANAVIKQGITVGENAVIGAGAVVVKPVNNNEVMVGVPAKPIKKSNNDKGESCLEQKFW